MVSNDQLTFRVVDQACVADVRNRIWAAWPLSGYFDAKHRGNSMEKNIAMGVRKLSDCDDIELLGEYLAYVVQKSGK